MQTHEKTIHPSLPRLRGAAENETFAERRDESFKGGIPLFPMTAKKNAEGQKKTDMNYFLYI